MEYEDRYVDSIGLFYDAEENLFYDEDKRPVFNIFDVVPPYIVEEFKEEKKDKVYNRSYKLVVELYYLPRSYQVDEISDMRSWYEHKVYCEQDYNGPMESMKGDTKNE